jgi:hypothetical protein
MIGYNYTGNWVSSSSTWGEEDERKIEIENCNV